MQKKQAILLLLFTAVLVAVLIGRFDWTLEHGTYAYRSYFSSLYLLLVFLPAVFLISELCLKNFWKSLAVTSMVSTFFVLPYHWLGLDNHFYHLAHKVIIPWQKEPLPATDWFPAALQNLPAFPGEFFFFLCLGGGVAVGLHFLFLKNRKYFFLTLVAWLCILLTSWFHLGLRSPYTYIPHFEAPKESNYWSHAYLYPDRKGAVNLDYPQFRDGEELYIGVPRTVNVLMNRTFPEFLVSPFTAFLNPFPVFLALNILCWFLAVFALFYWAKELVGDSAAVGASFLLAVSQGHALYVAQPMMYVLGHCGPVFLLAMQAFLFDKSRYETRNIFLFGFLLALILLCYDAEPWLVALVIISVLRKYRSKEFLVSTLLGVSLYRGYLELGKHLPALQLSASLFVGPGAPDPIPAIWSLLKNGEWRILLSRTEFLIKGFFSCLIHVFQLCFFPALAGVFFVKDKTTRMVLLATLLPAFLTRAVFQYSEHFIYLRFPRLVYSAYPGVFIFTAVFWQSIGDLLKVHRKDGFVPIARWGFLPLQFVWTNLDVWGFPIIYYWWFYLPRGYAL